MGSTTKDSRAGAAPIDIEDVPSPNEVAKNGGVVIVTVSNEVLRGAGRCILQIPVNVTSVSWNDWAACEQWYISVHYGDRLCLWLSCASGWISVDRTDERESSWPVGRSAGRSAGIDSCLCQGLAQLWSRSSRIVGLLLSPAADVPVLEVSSPSLTVDSLIFIHRTMNPGSSRGAS